MPVHFANLPRRRFLQTSLGVGASLLTFGTAFGDESQDHPEHVALLSDPHIDADATRVVRGSVMSANLLNVIADILAQPQQPVQAFIDGDCAFNVGLPADYQTLAAVLAALPAARIPLHMAMGNHDNRVVFRQQFADNENESKAVDGKHVSLIETKHANWFLTDTLQKVNNVTGELGAEQLAWLTAAVKSRSDKPAIVVGHHNPQFDVPEGGRVTGLQDSSELFALLESQPHVKAYVFGHTHSWSVKQRDSGLHLINLPPIGYTFNEKSPLGWVDAALNATGMQLTLHSIDNDHPQHMETHKLTW